MGRPSYEEGTTLIFSEAESRVAAILACVCSVLGALGNIATIFALLNSKRLRFHPTTLFLVSLSLSDLIFAAYNLPLTAHRFFHRGCEFMCLDWHVCRYFPFFFYGNLGVSIYIMSLVAVHRVFGVFWGQSLSSVFNQYTVPGMIVAVWVLVFGMLTLPLTGHWGQFGFEPLTFSCTLVRKEGETFMPFLMLVGIVLPCCLISASYVAIYWKVKFTGRSTKEAARNGHHLLQVAHNNDFRKHIKDRERELTKTLLCIFLGFIVCFLPYCVLAVVDPMPPSQKSWLHLVSFVLTWSSCFINPFIYCATNKYYLEAYKGLLSLMFGLCTPGRRRSVRTTETTVATSQHNQIREQDAREMDVLYRQPSSSDEVETTRL